ncbi:HD domain-containing phosphohydrolase [Marinospirillum alkaliphilum]|uniref:PilZ domain-containing protein n=1 Tax=Marinospirillum alkaliphilum DSM 21637 TaxID=1122209 RepID=A0A1K1WJL8_9GAMM|nr:HD domain-containing phosphohydrolase [Marinospirillum alkaliphilum]SFX37569.1 PilZ domain-containing protein [Marinospirillum alkaliphilum DSM 21637]
MALSATHGYGEVLAGPLLQQLLSTKDPDLQPRIQPLLPDEKPAADARFQVADWSLDMSAQSLVLRVNGAPDHLQLLTHAHLISLQLNFAHQLYQSHALEVLRVELFNKYLLLRVQLPRHLSRVFQRSSFRVHLSASLMVRAQVQHLGRLIEGRLLDLSYGGCRLVLPIQSSLLLGIERQQLPLTLAFPCGEQLQLQLERICLLPSSDFDKALLGGRFVNLSEADEKRIMRFTLETEREVARIGKEHYGHLKPSWLYQYPADHPPFKAAAHTSPIHEIADRLGGQMLLLGSGKGLSAEQLELLSKRLIQLLEDNPGQLHLQLCDVSHCHSLLLHHLRVAARFYPLALRIGISDRFQLALMAAILLHDLGRLLVDGFACPTEGQLIMRRQEYRISLLQLLRATAKLSWIPRGLAEAVIVNANEKLDGSGFPRGLSGNQQDSLTRALAVVKKLDCLTGDYPGQPALSWTEAYAWMKQHDQAYDLNMLEHYIRIHGLYPVGSCIHFEKGQVARVIRVDHQGEPAEVELLYSLDAPEQLLRQERITDQTMMQLGRILGEYGA